MDPIILFIVISVVLYPFALGFTAWTWRRARRDWPGFKLPTVMAVVNTIAVLAVTYLTGAAIYRSQVGPLPPQTMVVTIIVLQVTEFVPFLNTGYLVWLERRRRNGDRQRGE